MTQQQARRFWPAEFSLGLTGSRSRSATSPELEEIEMFYTYDMARAYQEQLVGDAEMEPGFEQAQPRTTRAPWVLVSDRLRAIETPQWLRNSAGDARTTV